MLKNVIGFCVVKLKSALINLTIGEFKNANNDVSSAYKYLNSECDGIHLGLDVDGTITEWPEFFRNLSKSWPGRVSIVSYRSDREKLVDLLNELDVYYDDIHLVKTMDKSDTLIELGINVYIDDQDECLFNIPNNITVMKVRNGGNFHNGKWLYSDETGILLT